MSDQGLTHASDILNNSLLANSLTSNLKFEDFQYIEFSSSSGALVEDLIDFGSFTLLLGESNAGKTFASLDLSLAIARGEPWLGKKVERGAVLYIAAEGGRNIKKRIVAYKQEYNLKNTQLPFRLIYETIDFCDPKQVGHIIQLIHETEKHFDLPVHLVVIDTLSRALSGGDENTSTDMGDFVKNVDFLRQNTESAVAVVHHTGKDANKGARGHSLLKCALDTELTILKSAKGPTIIKTTKQRDFEINEPIAFQLKQVEVAVNSSGKSITSCVVGLVTFKDALELKKNTLNEVPKKALETLKRLFKDSVVEVNIYDWQKAFNEEHYKGRCRQTYSSAFKSGKDVLVKSGHVHIEGKNVRIISD